ncbi:Hypothetical predicted protein, partial [Mytilus galloprovincialis]
MAQAASKTCEVCVSAPGSHYCIDCEEYYCGNCKLLHNRQKLSRNHQFQKASELIPEAEDDIRQMIGTYNISNCAPVLEKKEQRHGYLYRCSGCG